MLVFVKASCSHHLSTSSSPKRICGSFFLSACHFVRDPTDGFVENRPLPGVVKKPTTESELFISAAASTSEADVAAPADMQQKQQEQQEHQHQRQRQRPRQKSSFDWPAVPSPPPSDWALSALDSIAHQLDEEESAAIRIQAVHRGRRDRNRLPSSLSVSAPPPPPRPALLEPAAAALLDDASPPAPHSTAHWAAQAQGYEQSSLRLGGMVAPVA